MSSNTGLASPVSNLASQLATTSLAQTSSSNSSSSSDENTTSSSSGVPRQSSRGNSYDRLKDKIDLLTKELGIFLFLIFFAFHFSCSCRKDERGAQA
jgi:hypothetical protein